MTDIIKFSDIQKTTYVAAQPEWRLVYYHNDVAPNDHQTANFVIMEEEPIIAWAIVLNDDYKNHHSCQPVGCVTGIFDDDLNHWTIRHPDGNIDDHIDWGPGSTEEFLDHLRMRASVLKEVKR